MVVVFGNGSPAYVQGTTVLNFLKIPDYSQDDIDFLETEIIPYVVNYIDELAGTTWGSRRAKELKSIGKFATYGLYIQGAPIYLSHAPVIPQNDDVNNMQSLISLKIYSGGGGYNEWVGVKKEGRTGSFWTDIQNGIVYIIGWYWSLGYEAWVEYDYGYNVSGTPNMDGRVYELALLKSAQMFLSNERYTAMVSQGIGGIEMNTFWDYANKRVKELESYVMGFRVLAGGWLP